MNRVAFFIDGFNLYHAIDDAKLDKYKWFDLSKLAAAFTLSKDEIKVVYYFTAYATWMPEKHARHKIYVRALESKNVKIVFGEFKQRDKTCPKCNQSYKTFEEKETDVNIAIKLFQGAVLDLYDTAVIVSGDSDLVPSVEAVKETFPNKTIGVIIPIGRRAESLKQAAHFHMKMKLKHLISCQLPHEINFDGVVIKCPEEWK